MDRPPCSARRHFGHGFTLTEVMIAMALGTAAMAALVSLNTLIQRFLLEGFREAQLLADANYAVESMARRINHAYRLDASVPSRAYTIGADNRSFEFSMPLSDGSVVRERYIWYPSQGEVRHERLNNNGAFVMVGAMPLLRNVDSFAVDNQEGLISLVVRVRLPIPRYRDKQYTLIGRALPRNI